MGLQISRKSSGIEEWYNFPPCANNKVENLKQFKDKILNGKCEESHTSSAESKKLHLKVQKFTCDSPKIQWFTSDNPKIEQQKLTYYQSASEKMLYTVRKKRGRVWRQNQRFPSFAESAAPTTAGSAPTSPATTGSAPATTCPFTGAPAGVFKAPLRTRALGPIPTSEAGSFLP